MNPSRSQWPPIIAFVILVVTSIWLAFVLSSSGGIYTTTFFIVSWLAVMFPALSALLVCLIFPQRKASFAQLGLHKLGSLKWYGLALLQPTIMMVIGYLVTWAVGLIQFSFDMTLINLFGGPVGFVITIFIWAIGEEIGWRGFLQPRLTELFGLRRALILTGVVWVAWHSCIFFYIDSVSLSGNFFINLLLFAIGLVFVYPVLIGSMRAGSGSLWPAVIWHSTWNIVWIGGQEIFSIQHPGWTYVGNDSGIVCLFVGAVLIFWTWRQLPVVTAKLSQSLSS